MARILIVEDEAQMREGLKDNLEVNKNLLYEI